MKKIAYGFVLLLAASAAGGYAMAMQMSVAPELDAPKLFTPIKSAACLAYCAEANNSCIVGPVSERRYCAEKYRMCRNNCP